MTADPFHDMRPAETPTAKPAIQRPLTSGDIRAVLRKVFGAPERAICFEVAQGTGFAANRHLDAVAMELWPSRGLSLTGIEIKISRHDWRRELKDPTKAEQIARFLDYFYVAAPPNVVPVDELPSAWGLYEIDADGGCKIRRHAQRTEAEPVSRLFMAAIMRAATQRFDEDTINGIVAARERELQKSHDERVQREAERIADRRTRDQKSWEELVAALGEDPGNFYESADLIAAVKAVRAAGVARTWQGLGSLRLALAELNERVAAASRDMSLPEPAAAKQRAKRTA